MIGQTVILADESAMFRIGGLTQLERLLLSVEDFRTTCPGDMSPAAPTVVFWKRGCFDEAAAHEAHRRGVPVIHHQGDPGPGREGNLPSPPARSSRLLMHTSFLPGRGALQHLACTAGARPVDTAALPLAIRPGPFAEDRGETWEQLAAGLSALDRGESGKPGAAGEAGAPVFCALVNGPGDVDRQERRLFRSLGKESDGFSARAINRPLSTRLSRLLSRTAVTPNQLTFALLAVMFASAWLIARGTWAGFFGGVLLYDAVSILDGCDGELARVKFLESDAGSWIDTLSDMVGNHLFIFSLGLGLSRQAGLSGAMRNFYLVEGVLTVCFMALTLWGVARLTRERGEQGNLNNFGRSVVGASPLRGVFRTFAVFASQVSRRDTYCHLFVLAVAAGRTPWILHLYALGVVGHIVALVYALRSKAGKSS